MCFAAIASDLVLPSWYCSGILVTLLLDLCILSMILFRTIISCLRLICLWNGSGSCLCYDEFWRFHLINNVTREGGRSWILCIRSAYFVNWSCIFSIRVYAECAITVTKFLGTYFDLGLNKYIYIYLYIRWYFSWIYAHLNGYTCSIPFI